MIADGNYEMAATTLRWTRDRFAGSKALDEAERLTYLKLMEKQQAFNPFKFILYAAQIKELVPQVDRAGGASR
jgi:hypothetical protein